MQAMDGAFQPYVFSDCVEAPQASFRYALIDLAMVQNQWDPILGSVNSPPILEPILVGIGMFTGGTGF